MFNLYSKKSFIKTKETRVSLNTIDEKKLIIFSGDPYSINSEIIYKSWKKSIKI